MKTKILGLCIASLTSTGLLAADMPQPDVEYPAPPGVYGNPDLFRLIENPPASRPPSDATALTPQNNPEAISAADPATPAFPLPEQPQPPLLIMQTAPMQTAPVRPPVERTGVDYSHYPDAGTLQQQMQEASRLNFAQWGTDDNGAQNTPESPTQQAYLYGPELFADSYNYNQYFENPYPISMPSDDHYSMSYPSAQTRQMYQQPALPDYPVPDYYNYGYDRMQDLPSTMSAQRPAESDYYRQPPLDVTLQPSSQYPIPETVYGMPAQQGRTRTTDNAQPYDGRNLQYFRKIPEEEIIYPPNYPASLR